MCDDTRFIVKFCECCALEEELFGVHLHVETFRREKHDRVVDPKITPDRCYNLQIGVDRMWLLAGTDSSPQAISIVLCRRKNQVNGYFLFGHYLLF